VEDKRRYPHKAAVAPHTGYPEAAPWPEFDRNTKGIAYRQTKIVSNFLTAGASYVSNRSI
jgi:hypothetical protein